MKAAAFSSPDFILMAPMEGIVDHTLRDIFSAIGGIDRCTTEFIRITSQRLPERVFKKIFPEIEHQSKTANAVDVFPQILGDNAEMMAANAVKLAAMGAIGIDINFGCPAKTVNNHGGGSVLLQHPEKIYRIVSHIRQAVPANIPVTAKIRLGFKDKSLALENALAIESGGASEIVVHARTKVEGYKPPAHWQYIAMIQDEIGIDVIANGEMWTMDDITRCMTISNTRKVMLGRGLIACPELALRAKGQTKTPLLWGDICLLLIHYLEALSFSCPERFQSALVKQWLVYLRQQYGEAHLFFQQIKRIKEPLPLKQALLTELRIRHSHHSVCGHIGELNLTPLLQRLLTTNKIR